MPTAPAYYEGSTNGYNLVDILNDIIVGNAPFNIGRDETNKWEAAFQVNNEIWVEYTKRSRTSVTGKYKHTDNNVYSVYRLTGYANLVYAGQDRLVNGLLYEKTSTSISPWMTNTDRVFRMNKFKVIPNGSTTVEEIPVTGTLVCRVPDGTGYKVIILKQGKEKSSGTWQEDSTWNNFKYYADLPREINDGGTNPYVNGDWEKIVGVSTKVTYHIVKKTSGYDFIQTPNISTPYVFSETYYTGEVKSLIGNAAVVKTSGTTPTGTTPETFYFMLKQPTGQYTYLDLHIGRAFNGTNSSGTEPASYTYDGICKDGTVAFGEVPEIINQVKAEEIFEQNLNGTLPYIKPVESWAFVDGMKDVSGAAHFFFAKDLRINGTTLLRRKAQWGVDYKVWVTNRNIMIVLKADTSPSYTTSYTSFAYIGAIDGLNPKDYNTNFALTVGTDVNGDTPFDMSTTGTKTILYKTHGDNTANGMLDINMLRSSGYTPYQAHYPAFLTQNPSFAGVTLSSSTGLEKFPVTNTFQKSQWTGLYYASPIYVVHPADGYRGELSNVIAILDLNLLDGDELEVDTGTLKPDGLTTYKAIYKYVKTNVPYSMFLSSPNPTDMGIAVLTEYR